MWLGAPSLYVARCARLIPAVHFRSNHKSNQINQCLMVLVKLTEETQLDSRARQAEINFTGKPSGYKLNVLTLFSMSSLHLYLSSPYLLNSPSQVCKFIFFFLFFTLWHHSMRGHQLVSWQFYLHWFRWFRHSLVVALINHGCGQNGRCINGICQASPSPWSPPPSPTPLPPTPTPVPPTPTPVPPTPMGQTPPPPGCASNPGICGAETCCDNKCVDLASDPENCGICGGRCSTLRTCCSGRCANIRFDPYNCGRCFNICEHRQICFLGHCYGRSNV